MSVAAVIVAHDQDDALADAAGRPAARRIVEAAWAGGAMPLVVVAADRDGRLTESLAGTPARVVSRGRRSAARAVLLGTRAAREMVARTDALLCWPAAMTWVDPETVTSLIEAHGVWPAAVLRPSFRGRAGWPVLIPMADLAVPPDEPSWAADAMPLPLRPEARERLREIETGDPGSVHDRRMPLDDLAPYEGPPEPVGGPPPDWGAAAADRSREL